MLHSVAHNPLSQAVQGSLDNVARLLQRDVPIPWESEAVAGTALLLGMAVLLWGERLWKGILAVVGFTAGVVGGLCLREVIAPAGLGAPALVYAFPCGVIGGMIFCLLDRFLGFVLGSALGLSLALPWIADKLVRNPTHLYIATGAAFLMGGLLGLFFFRHFAVIFTAVIGALFSVYGFRFVCFHRIDALVRKPDVLFALTVATFLLLFTFGVCSQLLAGGISGAGGANGGSGKPSPSKG